MPSLLAVWGILGTVLHPPPEVNFGPTQVSKMDFFAMIVNGFQLTFLTIFPKSSMVNVSEGAAQRCS